MHTQEARALQRLGLPGRDPDLWDARVHGHRENMNPTPSCVALRMVWAVLHA
jgi:hypothetical protein